ncbi:hypothetical protein F5Y17DRAFT_279343 [Xylariaceae sp. FL0594]|nr:hypothetical protein F5Y17DRAFT_279343 [Xylariaceae sp. FL0594]
MDSQVPGVATSKAQAEMSQAFKDLARGEQQAAALEANLTRLESRLDAILAALETPSEEEGKEEKAAVPELGRSESGSGQLTRGEKDRDEDGDGHGSSDQVKKET